MVPAVGERRPGGQRTGRFERRAQVRSRHKRIPRVLKPGIEFSHRIFIGCIEGIRTDQSQVGAVECVILVGLPAAGKTTLFRERFAATHVHISKDLWPNATGRDARQRRLLDEALAAGSSVVIDNTNPLRADRAALIAIARGRGARVVGYYFDITTRAAVARNAVRTGSDKVPNVAIFTVAKRLETPTLGEGFDELYRVTIGDDRSLSIEPAGADDGR